MTAENYQIPAENMLHLWLTVTEANARGFMADNH
jgi:hypothetical protein